MVCVPLWLRLLVVLGLIVKVRVPVPDTPGVGVLVGEGLREGDAESLERVGVSEVRVAVVERDADHEKVPVAPLLAVSETVSIFELVAEADKEGLVVRESENVPECGRVYDDAVGDAVSEGSGEPVNVEGVGLAVNEGLGGSEAVSLKVGVSANVCVVRVGLRLGLTLGLGVSDREQVYVSEASCEPLAVGDRLRETGEGVTVETEGSPGDAESERVHVVVRVWLCEGVPDPEGTGGVNVGENEGEVYEAVSVSMETLAVSDTVIVASDAVRVPFRVVVGVFEWLTTGEKLTVRLGVGEGEDQVGVADGVFEKVPVRPQVGLRVSLWV
mmetsp:Transcript_69058/g.121957  ORF Transcript_69058/g.121957 Transcript_69058/m.121957 type:complete len:328 (+) Transcript_69058:21034-22017(+)